MPSSLVSYWEAWNESDPDRLARLLDDAVTDDVEWNDPRDAFVGKAELEAAMRRLHADKPDYRFAIVSEIDAHHHRHRYRWNMTRRDRILMEGLDIVTIDPESGLINRVDGFFGHPTPVKSEQSGVPQTLRDQAGRWAN